MDVLSTVSEKFMSELSDIREMLRDIGQRQAVHATEQTAIKEDVEQIKHVLIEGNGQPAMTVRVALAEQELARLREERDDKKLPRAAWAAILISSLIGIAGVIASVV
jgi:hypothetical protein